MSASGDATESQEPRLTRRGSLISALGAKPRESHMVGFARGSPSGLSEEGSVSPEALFGLCFCPIGRRADEVPVCWGVTGCKMKPTSVVLSSFK